jgi:hypothetical protein
MSIGQITVFKDVVLRNDDPELSAEDIVFGLNVSGSY